MKILYKHIAIISLMMFLCIVLAYLLLHSYKYFDEDFEEQETIHKLKAISNLLAHAGSQLCLSISNEDQLECILSHASDSELNLANDGWGSKFHIKITATNEKKIIEIYSVHDCKVCSGKLGIECIVFINDKSSEVRVTQFWN